MSEASVLVWAEMVDGAVTRTSLEALAFGRRFADDLGEPLAAIGLGSSVRGEIDTLVTHGADIAYVVEDIELDEYYSDNVSGALVEVIQQVDPVLVLLPHSSYGAEIAPRLAFRLQTASAMGCVDGQVEGGELLLTRRCYGGKALAQVRFLTSPAIATLWPKSIDPPVADPAREGKLVVLNHAAPIQGQRIRTLDRHRGDPQSAMLDEAEIVVAGGRGLGGAKGFELLEQLAEVLGGAVGASRPACDMGWYPQAHQVGISGKTIAPRLYIAVGISGADHHIAGCGRSKVIVAINSDADAPIFSFAHIGIVADYKEILESLIDTLREARD